MDILQKDKLLNKVFIFFVFFAYKKYSRSFIKLRLKPWFHMDYFTDLLAMFLYIDRVNYFAVYGRVTEISECIKISSFVENSFEDEQSFYGFGMTWG